MKYGEIVFDMNVNEHPTGSQSEYLLKRWKKYTIYSKSGSFNRTDNPNDNLYSTCSTYLYNYVVVLKDFYSSIIYTSSFIDDTPAGRDAEVSPNLWQHRANTFRSSSNAITNNYHLTYYPNLSIAFNRPIYDLPAIQNDTGEYFEIVSGYQRNHLIHKRSFFSLFNMTTYGKEHGIITSGSYKKNSQTIMTTIGENGLEDGSSPILTTQVGNVNLIQSDNVINK